MTGFHDVRFPPEIAYGASGGPEYQTAVVATFAGFERRNIDWSRARGRWNVGTGIRQRDHVAEVIAFFRARFGRAYGFRFKDWSDFEAAEPQLLGVGDGETAAFQLLKLYGAEPHRVDRRITRPVEGSVVVYLDGLEASGWSVDHATGVVSFGSAPADGVEVSATFEFDVPVRFDTDVMDVSIETFEMGQWSQIPLVELRE